MYLLTQISKLFKLVKLVKLANNSPGYTHPTLLLRNYNTQIIIIIRYYTH